MTADRLPPQKDYEPIPFEASSVNQEMLATGRPVFINDMASWDRERGTHSPVVQGEPAKALLMVPMIVGVWSLVRPSEARR